MKKIIIVSPHFPPSNLAAVHRSRLFATHLPFFNWKPIIVTVHYRYYEEKLDWDLLKLLPPRLRIERVKAIPTRPIRLVGDIGIRGFFPMLLRILKIIKREKIDFLYITLPSHYASLLGPLVHILTKTKYGLDYQDPWAYLPAESEKKLLKTGLSIWLARILEPLAVRRASLITGVASGYYEGVFARNPHLRNSCFAKAMPLGGEKEDYHALAKLKIKAYLFDKSDTIDFVYAGALLPKAYGPLRAIFEAMNRNLDLYAKVRIHFIGTGKTPDDERGFAVKPLAEKYGLWQKVIFEYPKRIPYLDVLAHLASADGIFILGSTEPHYTPSKLYQAILSKRPVLAVLHQQSTACQIIHDSGAGLVLPFSGEEGISDIRKRFNESFTDFLGFMKKFSPSDVHLSVLEEYSTYNVTKTLAEALEKVI